MSEDDYEKNMGTGENTLEQNIPKKEPQNIVFEEDSWLYEVDLSKGLNLYDAREYIADVMEQGMLPIITVPDKFADKVKKEGIKKNPTWQPDLDIICGTLGADPFLPNNQKRMTVRVHVDVNKVSPRMTSSDKLFHGTVVIDDPIPPELIEEI